MGDVLKWFRTLCGMNSEEDRGSLVDQLDAALWESVQHRLTRLNPDQMHGYLWARVRALQLAEGWTPSADIFDELVARFTNRLRAQSTASARRAA